MPGGTQAVAADFRTLGRTAFQRVYEVEVFRQRKDAALGKQSASSLPHLHQDHVKQSPGSEPFSESFADAALTTYNRGLQDRKVRDAVLWADARWGHGSPLSSV